MFEVKRLENEIIIKVFENMNNKGPTQDSQMTMITAKKIRKQ
jgi:hypothetical protein